ncbi:MAG TPA: penicillin acylase family protein, partial [Candidatus Polarisedimenticolia bacterium]|nr:penicillin acylase family protein [Candidatus Polarisedimenticolia bacterium]
LAELIGPALLDADKGVRRNRFRAFAERALADTPPGDRALLEAYAAGVNAGLAALRQPPFEYLMLRSKPAPWRPEDTFLVVDAMFLRLQDDTGRREATLAVMHDTLPAPAFAFLSPRGTEWDAPIEGEALASPPVPGADDFSLEPQEGIARRVDAERDEALHAGSNNWAVAASRTADGHALVASDMHLGLSIPNTWYHASLVWREGDRERRVTGVMLPGAPIIVVGSNGDVAWAFTNSEGDWSDLVLLETDPADADSYRTPDGMKRLEHVRESIPVKGAAPVEIDLPWTIWGPVVDHDPAGRPRALRWTAHQPGGVDLGLLHMEDAHDLEGALRTAASCGIPEQNAVVADASGRIGWTIAGRVPRRVGLDGRLPSSWADGKRRWDGFLDPDEAPRVIDPPDGRLWTANARTVSGRAADLIGDGGLDLGARARQIRDDLRALPRATPLDLLHVQLDDRALFLSRWRDLLLAALTPEAAAASPDRAAARRLVEAWAGRAAIESAGYRIVRAFRTEVTGELLDALTTRCHEADPDFDTGSIPMREGPVWRLIRERPAHLLPRAYTTWDEALLADLDRALTALTKDGTPLDQATWGRRNILKMQHPLSRAVPQLSTWLDMAPRPLPGDSSMPRVQAPEFGASERMVVSPGHEEQGLFHMPGGQSGHPLSPYYRAGHEAWVTGEATPFLPGAAQHVLRLTPSSGAS